MSLKQRVRQILEGALGAQIIPNGTAALVFEWEHLSRFFERFAIDCVFDVGANAGQYASMLRKRVKFRGHIISYEPIPSLATHLQDLASRDPRWSIEPMALDESEGGIALNVFNSTVFSSMHAVSAAAEHQFGTKVQLAQRLQVPASTLAVELPKQQARLGFHRPFLKLDTQGHDLAVARGAGTSLVEFIGLQSELAIQQLYEDAPTYREALDFFYQQGFRLSALVPNNLGHFPHLLEMDCIMYRATELDS